MAVKGFNIGGSRLGNPDRSWIAAQDVSVVGYSDTDIIVATLIYTGTKNGDTGNLFLQWRNVTDSGSFVDLSGSGELTYNATTDLVDFTSVVIGEKGCDPPETQSWEDGFEMEVRANLTLMLDADEYTENQIAVNLDNAHPGDEYAFRVYDVTAGVTVGVLVATLKIKALIPVFAMHYKKMQGNS